MKMRNSIKLWLLASVVVLLLGVQATQSAFDTVRPHGWKTFLVKHVPDTVDRDPLRLDDNHGSWGKIEWNAFLRRRLGAADYGRKYENTIVNSTRIDLEAEFLRSGPHQTYAKNNGQTMHWSNSQYVLYHFTLNTRASVDKYNGVVCRNKYIVVRYGSTIPNLPFHFEGFRDQRVATHTYLRDTTGCSRL